MGRKDKSAAVSAKAAPKSDVKPKNEEKGIKKASSPAEKSSKKSKKPEPMDEDSSDSEDSESDDSAH